MTESIPELDGAQGQAAAAARSRRQLLSAPGARQGCSSGPTNGRPRRNGSTAFPDDFANQLWPDDLERLEHYIEDAIARVPILGKGGVQRVINGPIPYSPDGNPYIGPAHGLTNFYQCCCFSFGIAQAGGGGKSLAEWIVHGEPEWDFWVFDPRRYTDYATKNYAAAKAIELYQNEYAIGFPSEERPAGRPAKTTPLYDKLGCQGRPCSAPAAAGSGPPGSTAAGDRRERKPSFRAHQLAWRGGRGMRGGARAVGILDLGGFTKLMVEGHGRRGRGSTG